jgi:Uma2 family endonuclease
MALALGPYTVETLEQLPQDGNRYELLDGELIVTSSPLPRHQLLVYRISAVLGPYVQSHHLGALWPGGDVNFDRHNLLIPDLLVGLGSEMLRLATWRDLPDPALAVEVLSPSSARYDRGRKRERYMDRVTEYWIVDPDAQLIEIWRPGDTRPEVVRDALTWQPVAGVPALRVRVTELFEGMTSA